jgi:hypothetical protein
VPTFELRASRGAPWWPEGDKTKPLFVLIDIDEKPKLDKQLKRGAGALWHWSA